jgi:glucosamine--fructose-6-phosphate aminotransferase (isomerizing)
MSETPELRDGPPWAMEEMILAEPGIVDAILASDAAREAATWLDGAAPVITTGCGTSEHAAMAGAVLLNARARDAFEAALDPQDGGVLVGVSHGGDTPATLDALQAARNARTVLITAADSTAADLAVRTPLTDTSWCHTVGYLSPLLAFVAMSGARIDARGIAEAVLAERETFRQHAATLDGCERFIAVASGADEVTAREISLKIEEGVHVPTTPLGMEKVLHGHLPAADERTGLVLFRLEPRQAERRDARAAQVRAAAAVLDMPTVTIEGLPTEGTVAGALVAGALALQLLTLELAHAAGTNPDLIRREEEAYKLAAAAGK